MPNSEVLAAKQATVASLKESMEKASIGVLVDYRGLTVEEDTVLRKQLREAGVDYRVAKNTLIRFAANQIGYGELDESLNGPTAMALGYEDVSVAAKILNNFAKDHTSLEIKAGFMEGRVISLDEVKAIANLPSREVLLAKMLGSLNAPISNLVRTLQALVDNGVEPSEIGADAPVEAAPAEEAAPVEEAPVAEEAPAEEAPAAEESAETPVEE